MFFEFFWNRALAAALLLPKLRNRPILPFFFWGPADVADPSAALSSVDLPERDEVALDERRKRMPRFRLTWSMFSTSAVGAPFESSLLVEIPMLPIWEWMEPMSASCSCEGDAAAAPHDAAAMEMLYFAHVDDLDAFVEADLFVAASLPMPFHIDSIRVGSWRA